MNNYYITIQLKKNIPLDKFSYYNLPLVNNMEKYIKGYLFVGTLSSKLNFAYFFNNKFLTTTKLLPSEERCNEIFNFIKTKKGKPAIDDKNNVIGEIISYKEAYNYLLEEFKKSK